MITSLAVILALLAGYVVGSFFSPVISKEGTTFQRISGWVYGSLTILWARLLMIVGVVGELLLQILPLLTSADIPAIRAYVGYLPLAISIIGLVTEAARRRSLASKPEPDAHQVPAEPTPPEQTDA